MSRLRSLDILRFVAVLLVIGRHSYPMYHWTYGPLAFVSDFFKESGYLGVDLFFVLSGFLVSGLLFEEQRSGRINILRFYVKRGFKIYPSFYALMVASPFLVHPGSNYVAEIFLVQNYFGGVWYHTWSLAVEEHFYLLLPLLLVAVRRQWLPHVFTCVAVLTLSARIIWGEGLMFQTHFRIDALLFGVLLSYYHHFGSLEIIKNRACLLLSVVLLVTTPFVPLSIAYTLAYVGFGIIIINFLEFQGKGLGFFAYLGKHSYSIYLWHEPVRYTLASLFPKTAEETLPLNLTYVVLSFVVGVMMSKLIEYPFLKLRDRVFRPKLRVENPLPLKTALEVARQFPVPSAEPTQAA